MESNRSIGKEISYISRSLLRFLDTRVAHLNLSSATIPFLTFLYENEGVHQDILAESLQFDKSSAARAVARLEKEGYISKKPDKKNRRRNIIRTTKKAKEVKEEIFDILKTLTEKLFTGFSQEEILLYFQLSEKIHNNTGLMLKEIK